jgi:glutaredoxin-related protein
MTTRDEDKDRDRARETGSAAQKAAGAVLRRGRTLLHGALVSEVGNKLPPLRWTRQALSFVNDLAGRPLCSEEELARREAELEALRTEVQARRTGGPFQVVRPEPAPVVLYVSDQDHRTRKRIEDILKGREIPYLVNDVTDDESSRSWALTRAHKTELPLLFIAGEPVGGLDEVMQLDVTGELLKRVFG